MLQSEQSTRGIRKISGIQLTHQQHNPNSSEESMLTTFKNLKDKLATVITNFRTIRNLMVPEVSAYLPQGLKDYQEIQANFERIAKQTEKVITLMDEKQQLNYNVIDISYKYVLEIMQQQDLMMYLPDPNSPAAGNNNRKLASEQFAISLLKNDAKVTTILEFLDEGMHLEDDIMTLWEKHHNYDLVSRHTKFVKAVDMEGYKSKVKRMGQMMMITNTVMMYESGYTSAFAKKTMFGLNFFRYFFMDKHAAIMTYNFYRKPTVDMAQSIWNLPEGGMLMEFSKVAFKSIKTNFKMYVPRRAVDFTEDIPILIPGDDSIQVRVLASDSIHLRSQLQAQSNCCCWSRRSVYPQKFQKVIIHFHGGGFISLSSRTTQSYTRRWANDLQVPVFSVDYRLAPQHPYPLPLEDCYNSYIFIMEHIHKYMNIDPKFVILAGDSAGGNLAASVVALAMKNGKRLPDALYLAYPAMDLRNIFSPSRLYSLDDYILFSTMLIMCRKAYIGTADEKDPLVSPVLISQDFVTNSNNRSDNVKPDNRWPLKWPKTRILIGNRDPLYDDSIRALERMLLSGVDAKITVFQGFGHACLSMDFAIPECENSIVESIQELRYLLEGS